MNKAFLKELDKHFELTIPKMVKLIKFADENKKFVKLDTDVIVHFIDAATGTKDGKNIRVSKDEVIVKEIMLYVEIYYRRYDRKYLCNMCVRKGHVHAYKRLLKQIVEPSRYRGKPKEPYNLYEIAKDLFEHEGKRRMNFKHYYPDYDSKYNFEFDKYEGGFGDDMFWAMSK